jgi:hypothetical protein
LVEQGIENPRVGGSIPSPATIDATKKPASRWAFLLATLLTVAHCFFDGDE